MTIKEGALVKAWDDDVSNYQVGRYACYCTYDDYVHIVVDMSNKELDTALSNESFKNAIEIPQELAKALEELGYE